MATPVAFQWKDGARIKTAAKVAGPVLSGFSKKGLTAEQVVTEGKKPKAPKWLKEELWLNRSAQDLADQMYLERARLLMRSIERVDNGTAKRLTFALADYKREEVTHNYVPREQVMANKILRRQLIERGEASMRSFLGSYGDVSEFAAVCAGMQGYFSAKLKKPPKDKAA